MQYVVVWCLFPAITLDKTQHSVHLPFLSKVSITWPHTSCVCAQQKNKWQFPETEGHSPMTGVLSNWRAIQRRVCNNGADQCRNGTLDSLRWWHGLQQAYKADPGGLRLCQRLLMIWLPLGMCQGSQVQLHLFLKAGCAPYSLKWHGSTAKSRYRQVRGEKNVIMEDMGGYGGNGG